MPGAAERPKKLLQKKKTNPRKQKTQPLAYTPDTTIAMKVIQIIGRGISAILILPVKIYQWILSPLLPKTCRYDPSCSNYMIQALKKRGPIVGLWLGLKRIGRCHPWGGHGFDPVPEKSVKHTEHYAGKTKKKQTK